MCTKTPEARCVEDGENKKMKCEIQGMTDNEISRKTVDVLCFGNV